MAVRERKKDVTPEVDQIEANVRLRFNYPRGPLTLDKLEEFRESGRQKLAAAFNLKFASEREVKKAVQDFVERLRLG